jgi:excisionase family DNA binding protein
MEERHFSLSEVAIGLRVSERTVRRWIKAGKLKAYKPGRDFRIPESAVRELIEKGEVSPKARAARLLEPSLDDVLADERREAFIRRVEQYYAARTAHYAKRLEEAEQGSVPPLEGYAGAVLLSDDSWEESRDLVEFVNDVLAQFWSLNPELSEDMQVAMARAVGRAMEPFMEIVRRIAVHAWKLGKTEEEKQEQERRHAEIREWTRQISTA